MGRRLYVLVRKDLPKNQASVQAGHVVAEYLLRGPHSFWGNETLIYLGVKDEENLNEWVDKITNSGYIVVRFREPDRNNELTAVATECSPELVEGLRLF